MIDAERMLGSLVKNALGGELSGQGKKRRKRRRKGGSSTMFGVKKSALAMGALGTAIAAFEHFSGQDTDRLGRGSTGASGSTPGPPPGAPSSGMAPPPGSAPLPPLPPIPRGDGAAGSSTAPLPPDLPPLPPTPTGGRDDSADALLLVRAMIAAAHADHELDADERARIVEAIDQSGATSEEHAFLLEEIDHPQSLASLAAAATTPDLARQVYLASSMAIDVDTESERLYLEKLAERLGLSADTVAELDAVLDGE